MQIPAQVSTARAPPTATNRSHSLLDLYAAADIPETELFGPADLDIPGHLRLTYTSPEEFWDAVTNPNSEGYALIEQIRQYGFDVLYGENTPFEEALHNHAEA